MADDPGKRNKENIHTIKQDPSLPVIPVADFLLSLETHDGPLDIGAVVDLAVFQPQLQGLRRREQADFVTKQIWERTKYRYM